MKRVIHALFAKKAVCFTGRLVAPTVLQDTGGIPLIELVIPVIPVVSLVTLLLIRVVLLAKNPLFFIWELA